MTIRLRTADVTLSAVEDGEPRPVVGDQASGTGYVASTPMWTPGAAFVSCPNAPSAGSACQVALWQEGNTTRAIACRDNRYVDKSGALALGDAAIVTDSEAWLRLTKSGNKIELRSKSGANTMKVEVDGSSGTITLSVGPSSLTVDATGVNIVGILKVGGVAVTVP